MNALPYILQGKSPTNEPSFLLSKTQIRERTFDHVVFWQMMGVLEKQFITRRWWLPPSRLGASFLEAGLTLLRSHSGNSWTRHTNRNWEMVGLLCLWQLTLDGCDWRQGGTARYICGAEMGLGQYCHQAIPPSFYACSSPNSQTKPCSPFERSLSLIISRFLSSINNHQHGNYSCTCTCEWLQVGMFRVRVVPIESCQPTNISVFFTSVRNQAERSRRR